MRWLRFSLALVAVAAMGGVTAATALASEGAGTRFSATYPTGSSTWTPGLISLPEKRPPPAEKV